jgi:hypothetical protein
VIAHVSLPALDCRTVAAVLAKIMDGIAVPFPPGGPEAWNCWSKRGDFQIVVTPVGQVMLEGPGGHIWGARLVGEERAYESHFAIAVERPAEEVIELARAGGWHTQLCNRGGFFDVVEVWVENAYLVEVLGPAQLADYRRSMTVENWKRAFGLD